MKAILVPVSNRPESETALQIAAELGQKVGASVTGCHLRPHQQADSDYKPSPLSLFGSPNRRWLEELDAKSTKSAAAGAHRMFIRVIEKAGYELAKKPKLNSTNVGIWLERVGSPDRLMAILGPVADLVVLNRPTANGRVARLFMLAGLLHSGRPVLVLPQKQTKAPGKRIAIAWNQSAEVARVVSSCMALVQSAEQVTIIACGPEGRPGPKASQLKTYLRNYGVDAKVVVTPGRNEEAELMNVYRDSKSDLLIMGAYSRPRLREVVFGGMTEFMLSKARIPVILQHT
jgi:nucleotide-binding universal stress UspA family protein